jgi:hypothetical protein
LQPRASASRYADRVVHEVVLERPYHDEPVLFRWFETVRGPRGAFCFAGKVLPLGYSIRESINGEDRIEEEVGVEHFPCHGFLDALGGPGPFRLAPRPRGEGIAALGSELDRRAYSTSQWLLRAGTGASGTIYNSVVDSHRSITVELDLAAMSAFYFESYRFDDG